MEIENKHRDAIGDAQLINSTGNAFMYAFAAMILEGGTFGMQNETYTDEIATGIIVFLVTLVMGLKSKHTPVAF